MIPPKKHLGQNFLRSPEVCDDILSAAGNISGENILEIGPGEGVLTERILEAQAKLTSVEVDDDLIPNLQSRFDDHPNFQLIHKSFLDIDLDQLYKDEPYSIIANIPYHITGKIFRKIFSQTQNRPQKVFLMVQKEVAHKILPSEKKGKKKRSMLSISAEIFMEGSVLFEVPRKAFFPVPRVDSAVIGFVQRSDPLVPQSELLDFFLRLRMAFASPRKKLKNTIRFVMGAQKISSDVLLDPIFELRPEDLKIDQWRKIFSDGLE